MVSKDHQNVSYGGFETGLWELWQSCCEYQSNVSNHVTNSEFYLVSSKVIENKTSNMYLNEQLITYLIFK